MSESNDGKLHPVPQNLHDLLFTSVIGNASVHRGPTAPPTRVRLRWQNEAEPMEYRTGGVADNDERALAGLLFAPFFRARWLEGMLASKRSVLAKPCECQMPWASSEGLDA